jgi:hypothetical protein
MNRLVDLGLSGLVAAGLMSGQTPIKLELNASARRTKKP